ncbi:arf-GAP with Rho-GAP domain, ANK repeat and PH domain-containing protein 1 isoform X2 [Gouania willdenowi]|uniref:Arf-GAP with Rho-GAP domain, ANK repeat and PH domain-containing protein 1-like n=1 Tax=Gouania willdenowi TaxID=441366 RepID=A0A8C5DVD3_GOUWI|nr:arf-GAP with Rho-GAP domain, ANK repeat and PH domain-containing protein 1-like isoform X2 [Gouania willdenowi]
MATPPRPPPPVPKPRGRFFSNAATDRSNEMLSENLPPVVGDKGQSLSTPNFPTLTSVTDIIAANIPSLAGIAAAIGGSAPQAPQATSPPPAPPSMDSLANSIAASIPALADTAGTVSSPDAAVVVPAPSSTPASNSFDRVLSSLSNIPGFSGEVNAPSAPPLSDVQPSPSDRADSESSNEEEDTGVGQPIGLQEQKEAIAEDSISSGPSNGLVPTRPAPAPPAGKSGQPMKQKVPRAATIKVSRKKGGKKASTPRSAMVRASWLDMWKGFRHSVLWATLDGQLMCLWKKRTDQISEVLFHVSSITKVKKQDNGRFSVYFKKKHYDFMAHSEEVSEAWLTSLLACRGVASPQSSELHGPITIKDPRSRVYAALFGHDVWVYPNKDSFQLGVASYRIILNIATVKSTGKHSMNLITPHRILSLSFDSSKEMSIWLERLSSTITSALSCSKVSLRLRENAHNTMCGDCGATNPEWASVNLLLVICHECAGQHRTLSCNLSKVRSLTMDSKVWTEPLIELFIRYGNWLANQVWAPAVPAAEQVSPESTTEERSEFIQDKYRRGRYKLVHPLSMSPSMMEQRLLQVVCSDNVEETMSLICSGAKVCPSDPQSPSPILLAEKANQALQTELLRMNEYTDIPPQHSADQRGNSTPSGEEEEEELHGKLDEDRFLFSLENTSAACDVLDLREVESIFLRDEPSQDFELVTLSDQLICNADDRETLLNHFIHILKVILPGGVSYAEVGGASAASKVTVVDVGGGPPHLDAWLLLWEEGVSIHPIHRHSQQCVKMELGALSHHEMKPLENIITMATVDRSVSVRFPAQYSCQTWFSHLQTALANYSTAPPPPYTANHSSGHLYPVLDNKGTVPPAIERCISHITANGLKVEGVYRRCGLAPKVSRLVEALMASPKTAPLEPDEQGVLDAGSALKQYVRQQEALIPPSQKKKWIQAAAISDEQSRFKEYKRLLRKLPENNRATLNALFGHFYMIQVFSPVNKMSAQNLAIVLVPSLFQGLNQDLISLSREFIIHHSLLFLTPDSEQTEEEEQITIL